MYAQKVSGGHWRIILGLDYIEINKLSMNKRYSTVYVLQRICLNFLSFHDSRNCWRDFFLLVASHTKISWMDLAIITSKFGRFGCYKLSILDLSSCFYVLFITLKNLVNYVFLFTWSSGRKRFYEKAALKNIKILMKT